MSTIYTWGYRGRTVDDLRGLIHSLGGGVLVLDVRRRNSGGRIARGWRFDEIIAGRDLNYWSRPTLGNYGKTAAWVRGPNADESLRREADSDDQHRKLLLLCAERDHAACHRTEVAEALCSLIRERGHKCEVIHL